jgi:hypothetical protein
MPTHVSVRARRANTARSVAPIRARHKLPRSTSVIVTASGRGMVASNSLITWPTIGRR